MGRHLGNNRRLERDAGGEWDGDRTQPLPQDPPSTLVKYNNNVTTYGRVNK